MKKSVIVGISGLLMLLVVVSYQSRAVSNDGLKGKYAIILQAGKETHEGMARAVHALLYSMELKEHGHEVVLIFDGAGTVWVEEWTKEGSTNKLTPVYNKLRSTGVTEVICDYCAQAFEVKSALNERKRELTSGYEGHPSIAKWANKGFQLVIL